MAIDPPDSLPNYLADGLPNQDREARLEARAFIDTLLAERDRSIEVAELPDESTVLENDPEGDRTIVTERVNCGADCTCNDGKGRGPDRFRFYREGGTLTSDYVGTA